MTEVNLYPTALVIYSYPQELDLAYPPPDSEIRNYLDWEAPSLAEGQTRYLHLLGHLFRTVSAELTRTYKREQFTYAELAKSWRKHLGNQNRARIYQEAVNGCNINDLVRPTFTVLNCSFIDLARANCGSSTRWVIRRTLSLT